MDITYLGHASFKIRGKNATVITDPYGPGIGINFPRHQSANVVTVSHAHPDHNAVGEIEGPYKLVDGPGEYEIAGVGVVGLPVYHDDEKGAVRGKNTIYRIEIDGLSIVHLGDLGHQLSSEQVEDLDGVNVLMVPVGGVYTLDPEGAVAVVHAIGPSLVIPMHFRREGLDAKLFGGLQPVSAFLKEMGKEDIVPQAKLTLTKEKLSEELQVVVLE